ncbi:MAG: phosphoheptose isomerase [Actinobacteria bacterium QS_8_72_14]|nr:MAG: phosphoheptose isomerase [Actinobacteria bacterium QS_8_72_14]
MPPPSSDSGAGGFGGSIEGLYPFLYAGDSDVESVLGEVRRSTEEKAAQTLDLRLRMLDEYAEEIVACAAAMVRRFARGGKLYAFGNGGSSTDAEGLVQAFLQPPAGGSPEEGAPAGGWRPLPAGCLTADVACVTALSNDVGFEVIFARQIAAAGRPEDVAVGLSTSGGSDNVLAGIQEAKQRGLLTVGFAGYEGGRLGELAASGVLDHLFVVPSSSIHRIQESQTTVYHVLWELTQRGLAIQEATP